MSDRLDRIRAVADGAAAARRDDAAIACLVAAIKALCDELEGHQHAYFGPRGLEGNWSVTAPERDTGAAAHAVYMKQQADKKKR